MRDVAEKEEVVFQVLFVLIRVDFMLLSLNVVSFKKYKESGGK